MTNAMSRMSIEDARVGVNVLERVSVGGATVVPLGSAWSASPAELRESAAAAPFAFAARLLGVEPLLVERQPIRPIDGGRSFASSRAAAPLHTDSQMFLGAPAAVQVLVCVKQALRGGESVLVDGTGLLARLDHDDPALARALFAVQRSQRFYFGEVLGPTLALRGGHLAWTVAPGELGAVDDVGRALIRELTREPRVEHTLQPGEALVASNHRMLHGRGPFEGERELVRLLVWLERPLLADASQRSRARELSPPLPETGLVRLRAVLAILRGAPPAKVAAGAHVDEATLYAWRDAFMRGGASALAS